MVSENLMQWQLPLVEPVLLRAHDADSFATFIPGDFTDVDKEAIEVPVMFQSDVSMSAKVSQKRRKERISKARNTCTVQFLHPI